MKSDLIVYWRRTIEVALLVAALIVMGIYWHDVPPVVVGSLVALLGASLGMGQSPMSTTSTTFKTQRPPPMPPEEDK